MRIFLVVSPPMGRLQGRSRSLTHMDTLQTETVFHDPVEAEKLTPAESPKFIISPPLHIRRQKLARSQVSSSEYFSVTFEVGNINDPDEFVVAAKGTSLADALTPVCSRRGISLSSVNVYLDAYKTPLPVLTTETSWLGGKHILIKGKDCAKSTVKSANSCPLRRKSGSYHSRGNRFFSVSSDESCNTTDGTTEKSSGSLTSHKPTKQRWSNLFGNSKDSKMELLIEHLNSYGKHGIPQLHNVDEDLEEALYNLEDNWRDIVLDSRTLMERQQQQQTAIWELVETEVTYIHTLRVLTDANNLLMEIDKTRLFSNILEIYAANRYFWCHHLLPMLAISRETGKPLNVSLLAEGFFQFDELFRPYTKYCAEQSQCQMYCKEKHNENELFTAYLVWCETQKDCNRLRLMDILVKPMQRITKYSLLLKAIHKHTDTEEQKQTLDQMISKVDVFVNDVNTTLKYKQEFEKLWVVLSKIDPYDIMDTKDEDFDRLLKSYNDLDLTCPMPGCCNSQRRLLLFHGDLKLKECNGGAKVDVHCFLFTDVLLVCKASSKKTDARYKVLKQPFIVDRLVLHELPREQLFLAVIYLTEYKVPANAFMLTSNDNKLLMTWASSIKKAQHLYSVAKRATTATMINPSLSALSRQPSSIYDEEWIETDVDHEYDIHNLVSTSLYPLKSPRGSSKGSSLNHSHSGSMDLNEAASSISSISQTRGISVENELSCLRGSSQSSDEGVPLLSGGSERGRVHTLVNRRKCASPNTLSVQVPVYSNLGQSLPNLSQMSTTVANPPPNMLLAPPKGFPPRGTSYPPPSPPLRRSPAVSFNRNPPLQKTRHISSSQMSSVTVSCDYEHVMTSSGTTPSTQESISSSPARPNLMKRLTRSENKRYHTTAVVVDDIKKQDKDSRICKRFSWNCGKRSKQQAAVANNCKTSTSSASSFGSCDPGSRNSSSSSCDFGCSNEYENTPGGAINKSIAESNTTDECSASQEQSIPKTTVTEANGNNTTGTDTHEQLAPRVNINKLL